MTGVLQVIGVIIAVGSVLGRFSSALVLVVVARPVRRLGLAALTIGSLSSGTR